MVGTKDPYLGLLNTLLTKLKTNFERLQKRFFLPNLAHITVSVFAKCPEIYINQLYMGFPETLIQGNKHTVPPWN